MNKFIAFAAFFLAACSRPAPERVTVALPIETPASPLSHVQVVPTPGRWLEIRVRAGGAPLWVENCNGRFVFHFANAAGISYPSDGGIDACRSAPIEIASGKEVVFREQVHSLEALPAGLGPYRLVLDSLRRAEDVVEPLSASARVSQPFYVQP